MPVSSQPAGSHLARCRATMTATPRLALPGDSTHPPVWPPWPRREGVHDLVHFLQIPGISMLARHTYPPLFRSCAPCEGGLPAAARVRFPAVRGRVVEAGHLQHAREA